MNASLFVPGFPAQVSLSPQLLVVSIISPHLFSSPDLLLGPKFRVVLVSLSVVMLGAALGRSLLGACHITGDTMIWQQNQKKAWDACHQVACLATTVMLLWCNKVLLFRSRWAPARSLGPLERMMAAGSPGPITWL